MQYSAGVGGVTGRVCAAGMLTGLLLPAGPWPLVAFLAAAAGAAVAAVVHVATRGTCCVGDCDCPRCAQGRR